MKCREANPLDLGAIFNLFKEHLKDLEQRRVEHLLPLDEEVLWDSLIRTHKEDPCFVLVDEEISSVVGFIWLRLTNHDCSREWLLSDVVTYIKPAYRKGRGLHLLIEAAKQCAQDIGCQGVYIGNFAGNHQLSKVYRKRFPLIGEVFYIGVK